MEPYVAFYSRHLNESEFEFNRKNKACGKSGMLLFQIFCLLTLAGSVFAIPLTDWPFASHRSNCAASGSSEITHLWLDWMPTEGVPATVDNTASRTSSTIFNLDTTTSTTIVFASFIASASTFAASPGPTSSTNVDYIGTVDNWRSAFSLPMLSQDSQLETNAQKTADESVGGLRHQLNSGSMAQVLAPGESNDFEHVFVGGWLCEIPSAPALAGVCEEASIGWDHEGQTGHAEVLTSNRYSKIGCAYSLRTKVWCCDLA